MTDDLEPAIRAVMGSDLWASCDHRRARDDHHSCPDCGGTLRRCCDSLVGHFQHLEACPEIARRAAS